MPEGEKRSFYMRETFFDIGCFVVLSCNNLMVFQQLYGPSRKVLQAGYTATHDQLCSDDGRECEQGV